MRGDAVWELALRAVDDHEAWLVLEDMMQEREDVRVIVQKIICRSWGRSVWPMVRRLMPSMVASMASILRHVYRQERVSNLTYRNSPLFSMISRSTQ